MKVTKTITLDVEIMLKIKEEENASNLINTLLIQHYNDKQYITKEEIELRLAEIQIEKEAKRKIEELRQNE